MNSMEAAQILGVSHNADEETVKKAYRRQAVKTHPDKPGGSIDAFNKIRDAYELLTYKSPSPNVQSVPRDRGPVSTGRTRSGWATYTTTAGAESSSSFFDMFMGQEPPSVRDIWQTIELHHICRECDALYPNGYRFKVTHKNRRIVIEADSVKELVDVLWCKLSEGDLSFLLYGRFQGKTKSEFLKHVAKRYMEMKK